MITVSVRLYATLRQATPNLGVGEAMAVELPDGATVGQLIERLRLPADQIKVVFVNNQIRGMDVVLQGADRVGVFPPVGGG